MIAKNILNNTLGALWIGVVCMSGTLSHDTSSSKVSSSLHPKEVKSKENNSPSPQNSQFLETPSQRKGWFVGIRAAYVPSAIGEIGYQFNNTFKLRLLGAGLRDYFRTLNVDGQNYQRIKFKPMKIGLMADWYPWKNALRLTGGIAYNGDKIRLDHMPTGTLLGQPANVFGTISARYKYRPIAPYLGIGFDTDSLGSTGLSLSADAGFWFQGRARSVVNLSGPGQSSALLVTGAKIHTEKLINSHKLLRTTPMISIGIRYLFF
ncbi:MAG: hypothetical protein FJX71_03320 [Alphaproteobacteria bacterium]|nr:hypothetical protein [Alphaproteobacteria bacterium]